ncbi:MAG: ATPase domain-containing protein [archaeon]
MEEKKRNAVLRATRKLVETKTPEEDILLSLGELGLDEDEAKKMLGEAKTNHVWGEPAEEPFPGKKPGPREEAEKQGAKRPMFFDFREMLEKKSAKPEKVQEEKNPQKDSAHENFIPNLRKGGRKAVKEIIAESPLDAREKNAGKKTKPEAAKESTTKRADRKLSETLKPVPDAGKKVSAEETAASGTDENPAVPHTETPKKPLEEPVFTSRLDVLEDSVSRGKNLDAALNELESIKNPQKSGRMPPGMRRAQSSMVIIPNREYAMGIDAVLRRVNRDFERIAYINLNEIYDNLISHLKSMDVDLKKFFFIDAITISSYGEVKERDNCIFVSNPNALIELSLAITQALNLHKPDAIIFDSISTLLIYEDEGTVTKFVHSLIGKIKAAGVASYFTALEGDSNSEAIKDLGMFVDSVLTLTEFQLGELGFAMTGPIRPRPIEEAPMAPKNRLYKASMLSPAMDTNRIVANEVSSLRKRLDGMQDNTELRDAISQLNEKVGRIEGLGSLRKDVKGISMRMERQKEKPLDDKIVGQISRLESKLDSMEERISQKNASELQKSLEEIRGKVGRVEQISDLQEEVKEISKKIGERREEPPDNKVVGQIERLEQKINSLGSMLAEKSFRAKRAEEEAVTLRKRIESIEKRRELEKMFDELYDNDVASLDPKNIVTKKLEKNLRKKDGVIEKAYSNRLIPKQLYTKGKSRIKKEAQRLRHSAQIAKLEQQLGILNEGYYSGVVSKKAYLADKAKIERRLKT